MNTESYDQFHYTPLNKPLKMSNKHKRKNLRTTVDFRETYIFGKCVINASGFDAGDTKLQTVFILGFGQMWCKGDDSSHVR